MKVKDMVGYLDYGCDGDESQMKVEVRGWYDNKMIIHYVRDYKKQEPPLMPKVIDELEVEHVYAKEAGHFVIDVVMYE